MQKVLVTGGSGYVGSVLIPLLLKEEFEVLSVDTNWFGDNLPNSPKLKKIVSKYSELPDEEFSEVSHVIHLANIANDPSVDLNQGFAWEINVLEHLKFLNQCKSIKSIKTFIYASSGSVYGINDSQKVHEDLPLMPISTYNKTKLVAEKLTQSFMNDFNIYILRPATVCGISPRMRFDVVVNMFILQAFKTGEIKVLGGNQIRPNIHIDDMARVYLHFLKNPDLETGIYNTGFENHSVLDLAKKVSKELKVNLKISESNDPRSYRLDSSKLLNTGFKPSKTVKDAIIEISTALNNDILDDQPNYHTVSWMKSKQIGI